MKNVNAIFAIDNNGGMGKNGTLPWPYDREDMKWFVSNTKNQVVVMGSNTWNDQNMPTPLPGRINVVITSKHIEDFPGAEYVIRPNKDEIEFGFSEINRDYPDIDIWVIGGSQVLDITQNLIQKAYITQFDNNFDCDINLDIEKWLLEFNLTTEIQGINKKFRIYEK